ncbi:glycine cleavage system H protein [Mortierella sp. GBAus27b]|nr:glycine cleavage system H protein [Mortierella sp. GBAus27b]
MRVVGRSCKENHIASVPDNLLYTQDHEWVLAEGDVATVGITDHAQKELGDIVFVDIQKGTFERECKVHRTRAAEFGTVESVKAVSQLFAPISGEVTEINPELESDPELLNTDPYTDGWVAKFKISNKDELKSLLDAAAYKKLIDAGSE